MQMQGGWGDPCVCVRFIYIFLGLSHWELTKGKQTTPNTPNTKPNNNTLNNTDTHTRHVMQFAI